MALEAQNLAIEAQRARNFSEDYLSKNPTSYKLQRDSERLLLASQLERAARLSYLAARRAEFEYAYALAWKDFRISDIYVARSPNDLSQFLDRLEGIINNVPRPVQRNIKDYSISVAKHILHYDDTSLGLTGAAAEAKRKQLFQTWMSSNTIKNLDGSETLRFTFSTSILDKGLFSSFADQKSVWLQQLSAVGIPNGGKGLRINIQAPGAGAFRYRTTRIQQGGLTHLRADNGCLLDFRLMRTQELYWPQATQDNDALAWQFQHNPKVVLGTLSAGVNDNVADPKEMTPANDFFSYPLSATEWQIEIDLKSPDGVLPALPKTQLTDVEILFSTSFASRQSPDRPTDQCPRADK